MAYNIKHRWGLQVRFFHKLIWWCKYEEEVTVLISGRGVLNKIHQKKYIFVVLVQCLYSKERQSFSNLLIKGTRKKTSHWVNLNSWKEVEYRGNSMNSYGDFPLDSWWIIPISKDLWKSLNRLRKTQGLMNKLFRWTSKCARVAKSDITNQYFLDNYHNECQSSKSR